MLNYLLIFIISALVDLLPFFGPPAWTVMAFFRIHYGLNLWMILTAGVIGSTAGRYLLSTYMPWISERMIKAKKNEDLMFIGKRLSGNGWQVQLFVLLYTLMPLPSTPLFTVAGIARIKPMHILPAFFVGKFISDMLMVQAGSYVAANTRTIADSLLTGKNIAGTLLSIILIGTFLFIDWAVLIRERKFRLHFNIWK